MQPGLHRQCHRFGNTALHGCKFDGRRGSRSLGQHLLQRWQQRHRQNNQLNELPLVSGSYASKPIVLERYTNKAGYNNGISGVTVSGYGTVYFATDGDGIFAFPNTQSGGPDVAGLYQVSTVGGK